MLVCVRLQTFVASVLREDELDALPLLDEEFFILRRSVKDEKNLLKIILARCVVGFLVEVLRKDEGNIIELEFDWFNECVKLMFVAFGIPGMFYVRFTDV